MFQKLTFLRLHRYISCLTDVSFYLKISKLIIYIIIG